MVHERCLRLFVEFQIDQLTNRPACKMMSCKFSAKVMQGWRHNWKSTQVANSHLVCNPTIQQPPSATVVSAEPFSHRTGKTAVLAEGNGDLSRLHSADKDAVSWQTSYGS